MHDVLTAVRGMKAGAIDFLPKPINPADLLLAVKAANEEDVKLRVRRSEEALVHRRLSSLTRREAEVLKHVIAGMPNKLTADALGLSIKTVKVHRGRLMQKMGLRTVADLVRVAQVGGISPTLPECRIAESEPAWLELMIRGELGECRDQRYSSKILRSAALSKSISCSGRGAFANGARQVQRQANSDPAEQSLEATSG
jgi:DNA-binding CsgD family transcriptional regulator